MPSKRPPPPRSKFTRASCLLQHRDPASPPHPDATGVASQLRGVGGAQSSAMAGEVRGAKRQCGLLDEVDASGSRGAGLTQPADKREEFGHDLGPPAEVRAPAAPLRNNTLIRKRLVPAVNAVEGRKLWMIMKMMRRCPQDKMIMQEGSPQYKLLLMQRVCWLWLTVCHLMQKRKRHKR